MATSTLSDNCLLTLAHRAFPLPSCLQGEALLARGERCWQPRVAGLPAPLSPCPAPRSGRASRRQESEERTTEKPWLARGCSCQLSTTESTLENNPIASSKHLAFPSRKDGR